MVATKYRVYTVHKNGFDSQVQMLQDVCDELVAEVTEHTPNIHSPLTCLRDGEDHAGLVAEVGELH